MRCFHLLLSIIALETSFAALAQSPNYNLGRTPSEEEISGWVTPISPAGEGLPPGRGTAKDGETIYASNCAACHGLGGTNGPHPALKGEPRFPYSTSIWDYINRAMPRSLANPGVQQRQLSADEVYSLTAYMLHLNDLVGENEIMDANSLPKVKIPIQLIR